MIACTDGNKVEVVVSGKIGLFFPEKCIISSRKSERVSNERDGGNSCFAFNGVRDLIASSKREIIYVDLWKACCTVLKTMESSSIILYPTLDQLVVISHLQYLNAVLVRNIYNVYVFIHNC